MGNFQGVQISAGQPTDVLNPTAIDAVAVGRDVIQLWEGAGAPSIRV